MRGEKPEWEPLGELPLAEFSLEELLEEREDPAEAGAAKPERKPPARPKAAKKQQQEDLHAGHRDRLRQRFLQEGLEHFEDHTILELLLFYAIPQRDTNELAHRLIREFGSFSQVFLADYERLAAVKGMHQRAILVDDHDFYRLRPAVDANAVTHVPTSRVLSPPSYHSMQGHRGQFGTPTWLVAALGAKCGLPAGGNDKARGRVRRPRAFACMLQNRAAGTVPRN